MQFKPPVMLFSAGFGTRMAPLTDHMPKPLIPVAGKPLVDHAIDLLHQADLTEIVSNTHYKADLLTPHLTARGVKCVYESEILETGGGLKNALPLLGDGPVMTLNSDSIWRGENPARQLLDAWNPAIMDALLVLVLRENALGHSGSGDFDLADDGRLSRGNDFVYSGLQLLKTHVLADIPAQKFSLNQAWDMMQGRLYGLPYSGHWCDVGRPESIALAESMLRRVDV